VTVIEPAGLFRHCSALRVAGSAHSRLKLPGSILSGSTILTDCLTRSDSQTRLIGALVASTDARRRSDFAWWSGTARASGYRRGGPCHALPVAERRRQLRVGHV